MIESLSQEVSRRIGRDVDLDQSGLSSFIEEISPSVEQTESIEQSALRIRAMGKSVTVKSTKFKNIIFNFKDFSKTAIPGVGGTLYSYFSGDVIAAMLTALAMWSALVAATEIKLEEPHARLIKLIYEASENGFPISEVVFQQLKDKLDLEESEFQKLIDELTKMKIVKVSYHPSFNLVLRERVITY